MIKYFDFFWRSRSVIGSETHRPFAVSPLLALSLFTLILAFGPMGDNKSTTPKNLNLRSRKGSLKESSTSITMEDISALFSNISRESEQRIISSLKAEISVLNDMVSKLESRLGSVQAECVRLDDEVSKMKCIIINQQLELEKNEKKLRANNLIFNNIPEGPISCPPHSLDHDLDKLGFVVQSANIGVAFDDILSVRRIGKSNNDKPRPLKVTLKNNASKFKFLNKRKSVSSNHEIKKVLNNAVFINCDNTHLVQKEEFRLRQKLKELKVKHPGTSCYIRSGSLYLDGTAVDDVDIRNQLF